jgi:hypothetical protein
MMLIAVEAAANIPASVEVNGGSVANLIIELGIGTPPDVETASASSIVPVSGGGTMEFSPDQEPFTSVGLNQLEFYLGNATLNYQVLCDSIFGCTDVSLFLSDIRISLVYPVGASFTKTGHADFGSTWRLQANYVINSDLFDMSGPIDSTSEAGFGATFSVGGGSVFINQMGLGPIFGDFPNDYIQVTWQTSVDLGGTSLSGSYGPSGEHAGACCYGDGVCIDMTNVDICAAGGGDYFGDNSNCGDNLCTPDACGSGGLCGTIHGPGCDDVSCCATVCQIDYHCCEFGWDAACAVLAVELCGATPGNDYCDSAYSIGLERVPFTTINSTTDGPLLITECGSAEAGQSFVDDVWFSHTPQYNNGVVVSTCGHANFDTRLAVYDGCNGELLACGDNAAGCPEGTTQVGFLGEQGHEYLIRVGGASGWGSGEIDVAWGDVASPPESIAVEWSETDGGNGHWYSLYSLGDQATYQMALDAASHFGGSLVTINSPEEQAFINTSMAAKLLGGTTAIGLYQEQGSQEPDGGWSWVTGEPLKWTNWASGEPNNAGGESLGMMYPDGSWNDGPDQFGHVLLEFESDPALEEVVWEIDDGGNGHTYKGVIFPNRISWEQAKQYAEKSGGALASFETEDEADWVFSELGAFTSLWSMTHYNGGPWIGLFKDFGNWWWLSEEILSWNGWAPGEPNETGDYGAMFGSSRFFDQASGPIDGGELFGSAELVDDYGYPRLKLVSDSFSGTWGTWISPAIPKNVIAFNLSYRFSFKNQDGGPGDGFSFLWGDLSDTSNGRASGGEWGVNAFVEDEAGLSVCSSSYPALGSNGVGGRWGSNEFAFANLDFSSVTYSDYQQAANPLNMATMYISWSKDTGVSVSIAFPSNNPEVIWSDQGASFFEGVDAVDWNFGFAARNGGMDMDVLLGDISFGYEFVPEDVNIGGGPRNTFDDTYSDNLRRSLIVEYDSEINSCPADISGDGQVSVSDLLMAIGAWGPCLDCPEDLDANGQVDIADLLEFIAAWGLCP